MIDLILDRFLSDAVEFYRNTSQQADESAVEAIARKDPNQSSESRQREVLKWLRSYGVFRGLVGAEATDVVNEVLKFADACDLSVNPTSQEDVIRLFDDLHHRCSLKVHRCKDGTPRDLTSLTSKALWCCYPEAIPIFDSRAGHGLCVLSRLMNLNRPPGNKGSRYEPFWSVWRELFCLAEPSMEKKGVLLGEMPHKVRVFDTILWMIGGPDF